jgi:hypothetical protein
LNGEAEWRAIRVTGVLPKKGLAICLIKFDRPNAATELCHGVLEPWEATTPTCAAEPADIECRRYSFQLEIYSVI